MNVKSNIIYVIGPSGVGKDTLMQYAREKINGQLPVLFAHRYITREASAGGENHIYLSKSEFLLRKSRNLFAMDWESHGNYYGIGKEILQWMDCGATVVVNGSREYLPVANSLFPNIMVILVGVSEEILYQRLRKRGRETEAEIQNRIEHSRKFSTLNSSNLIHFLNDEELESSGSKFVDVLVHQSTSFKKIYQ